MMEKLCEKIRSHIAIELGVTVDVDCQMMNLMNELKLVFLMSAPATNFCVREVYTVLAKTYLTDEAVCKEAVQKMQFAVNMNIVQAIKSGCELTHFDRADIWLPTNMLPMFTGSDGYIWPPERIKEAFGNALKTRYPAGKKDPRAAT